MRSFLLAVLGVVVLGGVWFLGRESAQPATTVELWAGEEQRNATATIHGNVLQLEVVRTVEEQTRGLSGRASLPENAGMLFVYNNLAIPGFWMPNMNFGLDIIWINENNTIVGIAEQVMPESYPKIFRPPSPIKYVIEVNAGWAAAHGVTSGDEVVFDL